MGTRDRLEFTNPYAGLADDFMPCDTGARDSPLPCRSQAATAPASINLYRADFDTGLAECAAACTEVEIGQAGHFVISRVQTNDGRFTGRGAGVSAVDTVFVQLQSPMPWRGRPQWLLA